MNEKLESQLIFKKNIEDNNTVKLEKENINIIARSEQQDETADDIVKKKISQIRAAIKSEIADDSVGKSDDRLHIEKMENGDLQIELTNKDGKKLNINELIPGGVVVREYEEFAFSNRRQEIDVAKEENSSKFLISLFHEIGHAHYFEKGKNKSLEPITRFYMDAASFVVMSFKTVENFFSTLSQSKNKQLPLSFRLGSAMGEAKFFMDRSESEDFYPDWFKKYQDKLSAKSERYAWQYALRELRKIKKDGFDIFDGFKDVNEVFAYIDDCLLSYEQFSANSIKHKTTSYDPIFLKKIKKDFADLNLE